MSQTHNQEESRDRRSPMIAAAVQGGIVEIRFVGKRELILRVVSEIERVFKTKLWPTKPEEDHALHGAYRLYGKFDTAVLPATESEGK